MGKIITIFTILIFLTFHASIAQDARFAQFYKAPQRLNPALTGVFDGQFRFNANYRDQWSSILGNNPFRTIHAGADFKVPSFGNDFFGLGFNALMDQAGNGLFRQFRSYLSGAYAKQVAGTGYSNQSQYLIAGAQIGLGQNTLAWNRLWFSDQFNEDVGAPDINSQTGETWSDQDQGNSPLFLDLNAGLLWYATWKKNSSIYLGAVLHHLNNPNISFIDTDEQLDLRWVVHAGGQLPLNTNISLLPGAIYQYQGTRSSVSFGANVRFSNNDINELAVRAGFWPHFSSKSDGGIHLNEWTTAFVLEWEKWDFGLSYGINASALKLASLARGAFELSMMYTSVGNSKVRTECPKF